MRLTEDQKRRILNHVYNIESTLSAHDAEPLRIARSRATEQYLRLGYSSADAHEKAQRLTAQELRAFHESPLPS